MHFPIFNENTTTSKIKISPKSIKHFDILNQND